MKNSHPLLENAHYFNDKHFDEVAEELKRLSLLYYAGTPEVTDAVFDQIYSHLKRGRPAHNYFRKANLGPTALDLVRHLVPMISIQTEVESSEAAYMDFDRRIKGLLETDSVVYISELKYDGLGLSILYQDGYLQSVATRGDTEVGENVTHALPLFGKSIPRFIHGLEGQVEIRGEAMITQAEFKRINEMIVSEGKEPLSNARNAVAGTVRTLDIEKVKDRCLVFFPYGFGGGNIPETITSQSQALVWFGKNFEFPQTKWNAPTFFTKDAGYHWSYFKSIANQRESLGFAIDGVVLKVDSFEQQKKLGFRSNEPRWAVAFKYPPEQRATELKEIIVQIGRTGKATPVALVEPVYVGGVTVTNITLHNVFDLRKRRVRVGDTVQVQRAGDVIPEIVPRLTNVPRFRYLPNFHMPAFCPCCDGSLKRKKGDREYYCLNKKCSGRVLENILHFCSRKAMNINGLGPKSIDTLIKKGFIKSWVDLYGLDEQILRDHGDLGANAPKVLAEIEKSKSVDLWRFIHAIGIPNIGVGTSKRLAPYFNVHNPLLGLEEMENIKDIGDTTIQSFSQYFNDPINNLPYMHFVNSVPGVKLKIPALKNGALKDRIVVFTGVFSNHKRSEYEAMVESSGGRSSNNVTGNTSFVVVGSSPTTHKVKKAELLGIPIMTEEAFLIVLEMHK